MKVTINKKMYIWNYKRFAWNMFKTLIVLGFIAAYLAMSTAEYNMLKNL